MSYSSIAEFYDLLTSNVNYAGYAKRVNRIINSYRSKSHSIVELACGTLSLGLELAEMGYKVVGIDKSEKMLCHAEQKCASRGFSIPLYNLDITDFSIPFKGEVFICSLDGLNHLDGMGCVASAFRAIKRNIKRGGLLIFDMNTPYKHRDVLGCNSFIFELPGIYCGWQNEFRESDCSVKISLDIFAEKKDGYKRFNECFREYAYTEKAIKNSLKASGFEVLGTFDELKSSSPGPRTERILYAARSI